VPSSPVHQYDRVGALGDRPADFFEVELHGMGVGFWHHDGRAGSPRRADGSEQIGVLIPLVGGLARPCAPSRPLPYKAVLLANPRFVLKPQLDTRLLREVGYVRFERAGEVFLYVRMTAASCAGWRGRALM